MKQETDGNQQMITDGKGLVTAKNIWGAKLIERDTQDASYSYRFDGHGDITALTDKLGNVLKDYAYDPYGNDLTSVSKAPEFSSGTYTEHEKDYNNPFQYCGEYQDLETGLYYLRARYYDPDTGRFTQEDTYYGVATDPLSLNLYTYCEGDPVNSWDPTGHFIAILAPLGVISTYIIAATVVVTVAIVYVAVDRAIYEAKAGDGNAEHYKKGTTNPANKGRHQKGQTRKQRDNGGEKGDARRNPNPNKRR